MNKKYLVTALAISILLLSVFHSLAYAETFTAFGPKAFIRGSGQPVVETTSFNIKNPHTTYTLHVYNGGQNSEYSKVSSAVISLNGNVVFGTNYFNQQVFHFQKSVSMAASNALQVELRSSPESGLTILIKGEDNTPPDVTISSPSNNTYLNTPNITVSGTASDSISWINSVSVNGTNAELNDEAFSVSLQLTEGTNTITAESIDAAGNKGTATTTVMLDMIPPTITLDTVPSITNNPQITITGKAEDASPITSLTINGKNLGAIGQLPFQFTTDITLLEGLNTITVTAADKVGHIGTATTSSLLDTTPPTLSITSPADQTTTNKTAVTITGTASDALSGISSVSVNGVNANLSNGAFTANINLVEGPNAVTVTATDAAGNISSSKITVYRDTTPPVIAITSPANGSTVNTGIIPVTGAIDDNTATVIINGVNAAPSNGTFTANVTLTEGTNTITVTATDHEGNASTATIGVTYKTSIIYTNLGAAPDPSVVAPPISPTVSTTLSSASEFLYTGSNPVQVGVAAGTIDAKRVAVIRGQVLTSDKAALAGVMVTILNHPEYGSTFTRSNGMFDLAVNGGGWVTVNYEKNGYLPAQRKVDAPWQDYTWVDDVILIPYDTKVTAIDLNANVPIQVAQGSTITDSDGTRKATLLFPQGIGATMKLPDGTWLSLSNINVRATEYTVGENGSKAMPAPLPPTSGYTYAAEFSIDEAVLMGATYVSFNKPVITYIENFLNFPVGGIVPVGWYDREKGAWIPSDNGKIIKILSISGGLANIDTDGNGAADSSTTLTALGITDTERQTLATLYRPGQSLWRVHISHFTPWDCNWPYGPPADATPPKQPQPEFITPLDDPCTQPGSIIECQNQTLGESINITGTPISINYRSDRVPGRKAAYTVKIPISGSTIPASLKRIELEINIAGRQFTKTFPVALNQAYTFTWDSMDAYGRKLNGTHPAIIRTGYVYQAVYQQPANFERSFGAVSGIPMTGSRARQEIIIWQESKKSIGIWDNRGQNLGGWTLNLQHAYEPQGHMLYLGNGKRRSAQDISKVIVTVAGSGGVGYSGGGYSGDSSIASSARLFYPYGIAVDEQGNMFIADTMNNRIRKIDADGIITTVAGNGTFGYDGDGGPATGAKLSSPQGVAIDGQGNLFIADTYNNRIRKVSPDGIITTVAGNGTMGYGGDGGLAISAKLYSPSGIAIDREGNFYIAHTSLHGGFIRKVSNGGIIITVAGNGGYGYTGDGVPATKATLFNPSGVAIDAQGNLFIVDTNNQRIRKVGTNGIITTVAGSGTSWWDTGGYSGDGGPAVSAKLKSPRSVAIDSQGNLFIADTGNNRIRKVSTDGTITTVVGDGTYGYSGDNGTAVSAQLNGPYGIAADAQGNLFIADSNNNRIRKVTPPLPLFSGQAIVISSEDSKELYGFDATGMHLKTVDAITGVTLYTFTYDSSGYLTQITDRDGNITTIERDLSGNPTAIVASGGQRTELSLDANGYLASISNPNNETTQLNYTTDGLLTTRTDPKGNVHTFTYDALGLLVKDEDPAGGYSVLSRMVTDIGKTNTITLTTAEGRTTTYLVEDLSTGDSRRTNTFPDGTRSVTLNKNDGTSTTTVPDGTITTTTEGTDPRFGMQASITTSMTIKTPGGKTYSLSEGRTVSLSDANNPLSIITMMDTTTVNGKAFTSLYDASLKKITATTPVGRKRYTLLDIKGKVYQEQAANLNPVTYGYDDTGRLTTITEGSRVTTMSYDSLNQISSITDAANRTVSFTYDLAGRVTEQTLPDSRVIAYSYDANGNVTSITPPGRPAHNFTFDPRDLETYYNPPDIGIGTVNTQYAYNLDKQLTSIIRPDGQTISLNYDNGARLSTMTLPSGQLTYSYNSTTGNISSVTAPGETLSYSFDGSLLTGTSWSGAISGSVGFSYNNDFRVTSESVNGANAVSYVYDNDGLLTGIGSLSISRDMQNGLITGSTLGSVTDSFSYSSFGEPSRYTASVSGSTLLDVQYTRDNLGRITSKTETVSGQTNTYAYTYDQAGRLTDVNKNGVNTAHYDFDTNGNRVGWAAPTGSGSAIYDNQDRLVSYGSTSYSYTANGELLSKVNSGQTTTYNYDVLGNLKSATLADGTAIEYIIDGQNRRIGKKVNGVLVQGFLYENQLRPVAELDGSGNVVSRFVYGNKPNMPEYVVKGGVTYRIITDHLGSPRLVVNSSTGAIVQQLDYDEFGNVTNDTNPGFQPFGFAGGLYDGGTKLVRFGARDYDPETSKWTAKDPIGFAGGDTNLLAYVESNPVSWVDPYGLVGIVTTGGGKGILSSGPGAMTGGIIGAYAGAGLGTLTGFPGMGVVGGMALGWLGGQIGGLVDPPCAGQLNCNEPIPYEPPKPMEPVQCH